MLNPFARRQFLSKSPAQDGGYRDPAALDPANCYYQYVMDCSTLSGITVESAKEHLRKVRACKMHNELTNSMEDGTFATHGAHPSVLGGTDVRWVFGANLYNIWYPLILTYLLKKWTVRMECAKRTDPPKKGVVRACVRASCARCRLFESPDIHCHDLFGICYTATFATLLTGSMWIRTR